MKIRITKFTLVAAFIAAAASLSAGNLDTLSNQSASYFFSTAQTAATSGAGIIPYNPAGTALLEKGFYLDASSQTILKFYSESEDAKFKDTYKQNEPTPSLPSLGFVYNFGNVGSGKLAVYVNGGICAGGGGLNWKDGNIGTWSTGLSNTSITASSMYYGVGGGLGYTFFDNHLSASAGLRYVIAHREGSLEGTHPLLGKQKLEYEQNATGVTPIFGLDIRPVEGLTLGFRYEMETALKFKTDVNTATLAFAANKASMDGEKANGDLPHLISFAAEYKFTPKFALSTGTNLYLLNLAAHNGTQHYFNPGYELNLSGQYQLTEKLLFGGAFMYSNQGTKKSYFEDSNYLLDASVNPPLDSVTFGAGAKYTVFKNFDVLLSSGYIYYIPVSVTTDKKLEVTYRKQVVEICLGASYKF